jgi:hypothetical protein
LISCLLYLSITILGLVIFSFLDLSVTNLGIVSLYLLITNSGHVYFLYLSFTNLGPVFFIFISHKSQSLFIIFITHKYYWSLYTYIFFLREIYIHTYIHMREVVSVREERIALWLLTFLLLYCFCRHPNSSSSLQHRISTTKIKQECQPNTSPGSCH